MAASMRGRGTARSTRTYRREDPDLDPRIQLDDEFETTLDPVTYQVLRWRFWNINLEHSDTIKRASGTPIVCFADDYNTSILTENGDILVGGPTIQYFIGCADLAVKWTLEHRGANPGIEDGDVFILNDPYIASAHQMDLCVYAPICHDGRIFCWAFSSAHQRDLGGTDPGSFCISAKDIFGEPTPWPATKLIRRGELQRDIMDLFRRQGRYPDLCELQIRAQIAGVNSVRRRMLEVLDEYGPRTVKGAMRRMISDASGAVSRRLLELPDGEWSERTYVGVGRDLMAIQTTLRKRDDQLIFSNRGTDPQAAGGVNGTFNTFRSTALCAVNAMLAWDQLFCPAGVLNHMQFEPEAGTVTVASHPAGVTLIYAAGVGATQAGLVVSKMLMTGPPHLRERATASGATSSPHFSEPFGLDRDGEPFYGLTGDSMAGGFGAFAGRDGVDNGGNYWWPRSNAGNVEEWESSIPMLYLYRRSQADSAGPGRFRGGNGIEAAFVGHKAISFQTATGASHPTVQTANGLSGGLPGHMGDWAAAVSTSIRTVLEEGRLPATRPELEAAIGPLRRLAVGEHIDLGLDGVLIIERSAGGGLGDPLRRDPSLVLADVRTGAVTLERSRDDYGIVIEADSVDVDATERCRTEARRARLDRSQPPSAPVDGLVAEDASRRSITDTVDLADDHTGSVWSCSCCRQVLAASDVNYRRGAAMEQVPASALDPARYPDSRPFISRELVLRLWYCPTCAQLLITDNCVADDPVASDTRLISLGIGGG